MLPSRQKKGGGDKHCAVALISKKGVASLQDLVFSELQANY